jgi:hypothetical protein
MFGLPAMTKQPIGSIQAKKLITRGQSMRISQSRFTPIERGLVALLYYLERVYCPSTG